MEFLPRPCFGHLWCPLFSFLWLTRSLFNFMTSFLVLPFLKGHYSSLLCVFFPLVFQLAFYCAWRKSISCNLTFYFSIKLSINLTKTLCYFLIRAQNILIKWKVLHAFFTSVFTSKTDFQESRGIQTRAQGRRKEDVPLVEENKAREYLTKWTFILHGLTYFSLSTVFLALSCSGWDESVCDLSFLGSQKILMSCKPCRECAREDSE